MPKIEPILKFDKNDNRCEKVVKRIGGMRPGQMARVEVTYKRYPENLLFALRKAYPHTVFTHEDYMSEGRKYMYIYIERNRRRSA